MATQIPLSDAARAAETDEEHGVREIAPDVAYKRLTLVNVVLVGLPGAGDRNWVLIDTGIPGSRKPIVEAAETRFGQGARPSAIVLTHGHFDHVGALEELCKLWDAPVYAHSLERQYLDGSTAYPPPDPAAGGGIMPLLAPLFPRSPVDVGSHLQTLPADGSVPPLPGWRWVHTPGHTPGHVSFWRDSDRALIVGDAFITTGQESAYEIAVQAPEMHGPPRYFTPDWLSAQQSVQSLAGMEPELVITGHGRAMQGAEMLKALHHLADNFDAIAVPKHARGELPS